MSRFHINTGRQDSSEAIKLTPREIWTIALLAEHLVELRDRTVR
jgi:hypothetical protein